MYVQFCLEKRDLRDEDGAGYHVHKITDTEYKQKDNSKKIYLTMAIIQ